MGDAVGADRGSREPACWFKLEAVGGAFLLLLFFPARCRIRILGLAGGLWADDDNQRDETRVCRRERAPMIVSLRVILPTDIFSATC